MAVRKMFELMYPNAAGIDIDGCHYVAVPADRDEQPAGIQELHRRPAGDGRLALRLRPIRWSWNQSRTDPVLELLQSRAVYLVNARHVKNVSGRKSDVLIANGRSSR
jgi:hypothetical protein